MKYVANSTLKLSSGVVFAGQEFECSDSELLGVPAFVYSKPTVKVEPEKKAEKKAEKDGAK